MNIYIANIDKREGESQILSVHKTRQGAIEQIMAAIFAKYGEDRAFDLEVAYCGNLEKGEFNSEEESYYIIEKELND